MLPTAYAREALDEPFEGAIAEALRAGVAVLDETGTVKWTNAAWASIELTTPALAMIERETNFFLRSREEPDPLTTAVAQGAAAVLSGATSYV